MSKSMQQYILIILGCTAFALVVYFIVKVIDAITRPSIVWFIIGLLSCLVIEGLIWLGFYIKRKWRFWFPKS